MKINRIDGKHCKIYHNCGRWKKTQYSNNSQLTASLKLGRELGISFLETM